MENNKKKDGSTPCNPFPVDISDRIQSRLNELSGLPVRERTLIEAVEWRIGQYQRPGDDFYTTTEIRSPIRFYRDCVECWDCSSWFPEIEHYDPLERVRVTLSSGHHFMLDMSLKEFDKLMK